MNLRELKDAARRRFRGWVARTIERHAPLDPPWSDLSWLDRRDGARRADPRVGRHEYN